MDLRQLVLEEIDARRESIVAISHDIHSHPELGFEEFQAARWLTGELERQGFRVERGVAGMETAFVATAVFGQGGPAVGFIAEYDALPEIGHACGHNIIGTSALAAGVGLAKALARAGQSGQPVAATVKVFGTPYEEGGGGKIIMLDAGCFDGVQAVLSMHPGARNSVGGGSTAVTPLTFKFKGKSAHAAASPHEGINALDAAILTFNGINALRQHVTSDTRIHGIITHGGVAPNIVPEYAEAEFLVRSPSSEYLVVVRDKVKRCAQAGADAAGAQLTIEEGLTYKDKRMNRPLELALKAELESLGLSVHDAHGTSMPASTDLGNISQAMPTAACNIAIADPGVPGHSREMAVAARSPRGDEAIFYSAKGMALTALRFITDASFRAGVAQAFPSAK